MITPGGAKKRLERLKNYKPVPIALDENFGVQNRFILDPARFLAAQCSRRAGKTNGLAIRFFKTLEKYPKSQCIYLALTFDSAKDIMMPVLRELNDQFKIGCTFTESIMTHPNGAKLKLLGADMKNFIKRLKGRKYPGAAIDEAQDFGSHLQSLIDDVLTPSISDYEDGWLAITGTPGPVPQGYFYNITHERRFGYSVHNWTLFDNPYMPNPKEFVASLQKKYEWPDNHPTLMREWKNHWVLDVQALWIQYTESLNNFSVLPPLPNPKFAYHYIMGVDLGFKDADALAIVAWSDASKDVYLVEEVITKKQGLTELVEQIKRLQNKYNVDKIVVDEGGLGKKLAEEMRRQHHIPCHPADKHRKQENVEFLNDSLRLGRFKAKADSQFAKDSYLVQIDWDKSSPNKIVIKKHPHSDIIDAVLYAFKESPAYAFTPEPVAPRYGSKEWADQQESSMFDAEVEKLQQEQELAKLIGGDYD